MAVIHESDILQIKKDDENNALVIKLSGFAQKDKAASFVSIYQDAVSKVTPSTINLIIDSTELKTFHQEILPVLTKSYELYMSSGFKKVIMVNPKDIAAKMQLARVARSAQFNGVFVDSIDEAYSLSKQ